MPPLVLSHWIAAHPTVAFDLLARHHESLVPGYARYRDDVMRRHPAPGRTQEERRTADLVAAHLPERPTFTTVSYGEGSPTADVVVDPRFADGDETVSFAIDVDGLVELIGDRDADEE